MTDGFTTGDLSPLMYCIENSYGDTPIAGWLWGPETTGLTPKDALDQAQIRWGGDRSLNMKTMVSQGLTAGFSLKWNERDRIGWAYPMLTSAMGTANGTSPQADLPSFSAIYNEGGNYMLYNGCKINSLKMSAARPRAIMEFEADIMARYVEGVTAAGVVNGLQSKTITFPTPEHRSLAPALQWVRGIDLDDNLNLYPQSWDLTISNGLDREEGAISGSAQTYYYGTRALRGGDRTLALNLSMFMKDWSMIDAQLANTAIDSVDIVLGSRTLRLEDGRYVVDGGNWPSFAQQQMMIPVKMTFARAVLL